jgi:glycosyltransferase involved in cell wall biosynthesis
MRLFIVVPSYNQGRYIERSLKSVLDQNYPDLEFWIIDGGSTDGTLDLLRRYEDRLRWISEKDDGQSDAVNKGWARCTGEVIGWTNSDDTYESGSFEAVMKVFREHPEVDFVCGDCNVIDDEDYVLRTFKGGPFNVRDHIRQGFCDVYNRAVFYRRSLLDRVGFLDTSLYYATDYDLFCRMGQAATPYHIPQALGNLRHQEDAKTRTGQRKMIQESRKVRSKYMKGAADVPWTWYYDFRFELYVKLEPLLLRRKAKQPSAG